MPSHPVVPVMLQPVMFTKTVRDELYKEQKELLGSPGNGKPSEVELVGVVGRELILRDSLAESQIEFDILMIDCPPSLGLLTLNGLAAVQEVIIPMLPHFLALQGVGKLLETVELVHKRINPLLSVTGVVMCMFESRTQLGSEVVADLRDFFVEKIGISEKPSPKDYADVLVDLSQKDGFADEDEQTILKIYKELNYHLNLDNVHKLISDEDWWDDFISKPVFFAENKKFSNTENVFINDRLELYNLFKNEANIAFLLLPENFHPDKIKFFIESAKIRYLSKVVVPIPNFDKSSCSELKEPTAQVQDSMPYIIQYLYSKMHGEYERLKENGFFKEITNLEVYSVDKLQVIYEIPIRDNRSVSPPATRPCLPYENKLYVSKEYESNKDHVAIELSKMFGEIKGLDDFIMLIFEKQTKKKIENLMSAKGIPELPESERDVLEVLSRTKTETTTRKSEEIPTTSTGENDEITIPEKSIVLPASPQKRDKSMDRQEEWTPEITPGQAEIKITGYEPKKHFYQPRTEDVKPPDLQHDAKPSPMPSLIPSEAAKAIGSWGEEYALNCLKDKKHKEYPDTKVSDTDEGFVIEKDGEHLVKVIWLNKSGERGERYDIELIENSITYYIEVKSTKTKEKDWFDVSKGQWELIQEKGDKFWIYRVYGAGTEEPVLEEIPNPFKLCQDGDIVAHPIRFRIHI